MTENTLKPGWTIVKFGDVVNLNKDRLKDPAAAGIKRYVGLEHITPEDLRIRRWGLVADGTTFTNAFKPGQVLFGKRRAYQRKVAVANFSGICSGDIYVFEPKDKRLLPNLLPFLCQTERFYEHAVGTSAGSLSPRTNWKQLAQYEFALPPLAEQRRIAEVLWAATRLNDRRRELVDCTHKTLKAASMNLFQKMLKKNPELIPLSKISSLGPQSGLYKKKDFYGWGCPMVHMGELFGNDWITSDIEMQLVNLTDKEIKKYSLTPNDLLFGRRSIVLEGAGKCVLVKSLSGPITFESSMLRVTLKPEFANNQYVFEWFNSPEGARLIHSIVTFTTVAGVKGSDVAKLKVPLPDLNAQQEIVEHLNFLRDGIKATESSAHGYQVVLMTLKETLLWGHLSKKMKESQ